MTNELNKELNNQEAEQDVIITEESLEGFEITEQELEDVSGGLMPAFVRADYPGFFAKYK